MLAATQRLRRHGEFTAVLRGGRRAGRGGLVVHIGVRPDGAGGARAGFIVPKTVGNAVTRNTVRRRLRNALRDRLVGLPDDVDVVVRVLPAAATATYRQLVADLDGALSAAWKRGVR
jgi:ribonuclease P protein component